MLLLLCGMIAFADTVSQTQARKVAEEFFAVNSPRMASGSTSECKLTLCKTPALNVTPSSVTPSLYVFNRENGGFVIVSGDDSVEQILAYSEDGFVDENNIPDNMMYWLRGLDSEIRAVAASAQKNERHISWNAPKKAGNVVLELTTAKWDQESPYWNECPMVGSSRTLTGCVATAAAIVCRYHQWPTSGTGSTPKYSTYSRRISIAAYTLGRTYDYSQMPLTYTSSATSAQKAAVAALMFDLGRSCYMDYGTASDGGSGAETDDLLNALINNFKYKNTAKLRTRSSYTDANWIKLVQDDLKASGPVLYGGYESSGGGHQFLFDGYRDDNYFRVNWGWSGSGNGYFLVTRLGGSSIGYTFSQGQDAVIGLVPDKEKWAENLEDQTSLSYDRTTHKLTVKCAMAATTTLKDAAGASKYSKNATAGQSQTIDLTGYAAGKYTLTLTSGSLSYSVTIKL